MKKQIISLIIIVLLPMAANADAVEIDGIYYNLIPKGKVAEVTSNPKKYAGSIIIPETVEFEGSVYNVTSIGKEAFSGCSGLTSVTIPNSVTSIGESSFSWCSGLTSVTIPNSVTSINGGAFANCGLTSVTIGNSVTSIGNNAFSDCSGLTSVNIPNSVTSIGDYAFRKCSGLTSVTIPNSVTSIVDTAFVGCSGLTSVTIPNSVKSIGWYAFLGCTGLTNLNIPNSVTSIVMYAFSGCSGLTTVTIPNSVNSIGIYAFEGCSGLTSVTVGSSIKSIGKNSFSNCALLTDVYCLAEKVPSTDATAFDGSYTEYATLHVPASAINAYKMTAPWSNFQEIVPTEDVTIKKCATPTVTFADGKLKFGCETEGVEYVYEVTMGSVGTTAENEVELKPTFRVTVYAKKEGFVNSDVATADIAVSCKPGDTDGDGEVNAVDLTKLIDILLKR